MVMAMAMGMVMVMAMVLVMMMMLATCLPLMSLACQLYEEHVSNLVLPRI